MGRKRARVSNDGAARVWPMRSGERLITIRNDGAATSVVSVCGNDLCFRDELSESSKMCPLPDIETYCLTAEHGTNRYFTLYPPKPTEQQSSIWLVDAMQKELLPIPVCLQVQERVAASFASHTGRHVAALIVNEGDKSAFIKYQSHTPTRSSDTSHSDGVAWASTSSHPVASHHQHSVGHFFESPLFGEAFLLVTVSWSQEADQWTINTQLYRVGSVWKRIASHQQRIKIHASNRLDDSRSHRVWLSPSGHWIVICDEQAQRISCVAVKLFGSDKVIELPSAQSQQFDAQITDIAVGEDDAAAVLLENGQVCILALPSSPEPPSLSPIAVQVNGTVDVVSISLSTLLPAGINPGRWQRIVWIPTQHKLYACSDTTLLECQLKIEQISDSTVTVIPPLRDVAPPPAQVEAMVQSVLSDPHVTASDLMTVACKAITANDCADADVALAILGVALLRLVKQLGLAPASAAALSSDGDIAIHVGIMEMLVAQLVTLDAVSVHRIAEKIVRAPVFHTRRERIAYYESELHTIVSSLASGHQRLMDTHVREIFLKAFHPRVTQLLLTIKQQRLAPLTDLARGESATQQAQQLLQRVTQLGATPVDQLQALLLCYTLVCEYYCVDHAELEVSRLLHATASGDAEAMLQRAPFVVCFLTIKYHRISAAARGSTTSSSPTTDTVLRLAAVAGVSSQLVQFCASLDVERPFELFRHSQRPLDIDMRRCILHQCIIRLTGLLRSAPLIRRRHQRTSAMATPPTDRPSVKSIKTAAFDSFIKIATGAAPETGLNHLQDPSLVGAAASVCQAAIHHLRKDDAAVNALFADVFLYHQLWAMTDTQLTATAAFAIRVVGGHSHEATVTGRVLGASTWHLGSGARHTDLQPELRSMATLLWTLWVRECCGLVKTTLDSHRADPIQSHEELHELGRMAAWCALHLKAVRLYGDPGEDDDVAALQLTLLEAAAELHTSATAHIVMWGFTSESFPARLLRRYRALESSLLRKAIQDDDCTATVAGNHLKRLRGCVVGGDFSSLPPNQVLAVDVAVTCCCDVEFQRLLWALIQRRFVAAVTVQPTVFKPVAVRENQTKRPLLRAASSASMVSRSEVLRLLESQRREIEQQLQRATANATPQAVTTASPTVRTERPVSTTGQDQAVPSLARSQYVVRDLAFSPEASPPSPTRIQVRKTSSTQNVLKLLQLRKETQEIKRHQSAPRMVPVIMKSSAAVENEKPLDQKSPKAAAPRRSIVRPLRYDDRVPTAELQLLHTVTQGERSVPLTRRSFRLPINRPAREQAPTMSEQETQCVELKTTSIQTDAITTDASNGHTDEQPPLPRPAAAPAVPIQTLDQLPTRPSLATGVQCDLSSQRDTNEQSTPPPSRFPVYVDLPPAASGSSFLHVARLTPALTTDHGPPPPPRVKVARVPPSISIDTESSSSPASTQPLPVASADDQPSQGTVLSQQQQTDRLQRHRERYRSHFAPSVTLSSSTMEATGGLSSFVALKSEMQRMKAKLLELESCAEDLDVEFKASHHKLESIGGSGSSREQVLHQVDHAVHAAEAMANGSTPPGTLAVKATRDLEDATRLLAQLETLTSSTH